MISRDSSLNRPEAIGWGDCWCKRQPGRADEQNSSGIDNCQQMTKSAHHERLIPEMIQVVLVSFVAVAMPY